MTKQDPSKAEGQMHAVKGSVVESVGDMTGSQGWSQAGKEEHASGEGEYKAAQAKGLAQGVADRMGGYKDSIVGAITGDKSQQAAGNVRKEEGRAQQKANEPARD